MKYYPLKLLFITFFILGCTNDIDTNTKPNILFIMSDDHAYQAISAYDDRLIQTPNIDRIADEGMLFTNASVTNSICAPSRAVILTGKHSHINGKIDNIAKFDDSQMTFPQLFKKNGYQTAMFGKLHFGNNPKGIDDFLILPGQGDYINPRFLGKEKDTIITGYVTDVITDLTLDWFKNKRDDDKPFLTFYLHKAPHRAWWPSPEKFAEFYNKKFPEPETLYDDYSNRGTAAKTAEMNLLTHMQYMQDSKVRPSVFEKMENVEPKIVYARGDGTFFEPSSNSFNNRYGRANEDQKKKWLPKLASAEWIGAWGLTEHNTGSDAGGMATTAVKDGDYWVLNGAKNFITHAISGDIAVVIARTGEKGDSHGMTAFVIEKGISGFSSGKKEDKLGMRASETAELIFDNCKVPDENVLGSVGDGFIQSMKVLDGGRISIAALSLGIAKGAFQAALQYSKERIQFGKPISKFQAIAFKLSDMATEIEASELLIYNAAEKKNRGDKMTLEGAMSKYYSSEVAVKIATDAVQILGGYGYTKDFVVERFYRDSKLCTIGEGTSEIQKLVIAKQIIG